MRRGARRLIETLDAALPPELARREPSDQGMHLVLWLAGDFDDRRVAALSLEAGVAVRPVSPIRARHGAVGAGAGLRRRMEAAARTLAAVIVAARHEGTAWAG
ncbi:MAG: hypothetical protein GAK41_00272 [Burkholderia gladioli]|nr:MAG: hypothetical protein GAK41_00272 [Burkholderia gladioli]